MARDTHDIEKAPLDGSTSLRLVRIRLWLALVTMFVIPLALIAPVLYTLAERWNMPMLQPTLAIIALTFIMGLLTAWLARRVLESAEQLEQARAWLHEAYERALEESLRDPLTGLGNHRAFQEALHREVATASRYHTSVALVLIDLDDFKKVNDTQGHARGDLLLAAAARLMVRMLRQSDRVFRVGGDEFAILMPHTDADAAAISIRRLLAAALEAAAAEPDRPAFSFSAGITDSPRRARDREEAYRQADAALYWGKRHGRTSIRVYEAQEHEAAFTDRPTAELSAAVERVAATRSLRAVFQPIVDLEDGRIVGYEGLVRPLPDSDFADPSVLFTAAEATGRTVELDMVCIDTVLAAAAGACPEGYLSINVSPRTLESKEFGAGLFRAILARHAIDPGRIVLEVTEREPVEDLKRLRRMLNEFQAMGIRVAADDVGAGNAGLRLLSQIRFDIVKIDLSLVQSGIEHASSLEVLTTLRDLGNRWRALVVAEGVETPAQLGMVRELGFAAAQGYLLGRPMAEPPVGFINLAALGLTLEAVGPRRTASAGLVPLS